MSEVVEPLAFTIPSAVRASGLSRTRIYDLLISGDLAAFKVGRRTMIRADSLRAYLASLPPAAFHAPKGRAAGKAL
jgi:excisionase family DNA binding protein